MKKICFTLFLLILLAQCASRILKDGKTDEKAGERELQIKMVGTQKNNQNRKLGLEEDLQREHEDEQNLNNMKLMMINMKKDGELRTLQSIMNDIGDRVEEINDTIRMKTVEFMDKVDSVMRQTRNNNNILSVRKPTL